jgi:hypothetical protein
MMNQAQSSSAVYGLFHEVEYEGQVLLGLYNLESEAEAARSHYISLELQDFTNLSSEELKEEQYRLKREVVVRRLAMGQVPDYHFSA